jgi:hypothetical protein
MNVLGNEPWFSFRKVADPNLTHNPVLTLNSGTEKSRPAEGVFFGRVLPPWIRDFLHSNA